MKRRKVLASLAAAGTALPLTGCTSPLTARLRHEVVDGGDGETNVRFYRGDAGVATMTYLLGSVT